jgi:3',5'-cyclic AMP phosphodiesterase CpdA
MRKIVHISDLHFGKVIHSISEALLEKINSVKPDLVVVSGDFTQRGRRKQYSDAKDYMAKINFPKLVTPGNHDIPLFDLFRRMLLPLQRYKKYITNELSPLYVDNEIIAFGINTARSFTWKNGRISIDQIKEMEEILCPLGTEKIKIVVTHHPFIPPPGDAGIALVGRSVKALRVIDKCNVDLLLAGHLHQGYSGDVRTHFPTRERSVISIQAGTAISSRTRKEANAFNLITVEKEKIIIEICTYDGTMFTPSVKTEYYRSDNEWIREKNN